MGKVFRLLIIIFLLTQCVFAAIVLRINVSPAGTYTGTLYRYDAVTKARVGPGKAIITNGSGIADVNLHDGTVGLSYYWGLELSGKAENFANNKVYLADATSVTSVAPITNIYFDAFTGYTLQGQIRNAVGTPLGAGIAVKLFEPNYVYRYGATTDGSGNFSFSDVAPGKYFIKAGDGSNYFPLWYSSTGGAYGSSDWTPINVAAVNISGLNINLPLSATVSGTVAAYGGGPLAAMNVQAFFKDGNFDYVNQATTDGSGNYSMSIPAAKNLMVRASGVSYSDTFYDQAYTWQSATTINASPGAILSGRNFSMHRPWFINGSVNIPGAKIEIFEYNNWQNYIGEATADGSGNFSVSGNNNMNVMIRYSAGNNYTKVVYPNLTYFSNIGPANSYALVEGNSYNLSAVTLGSAGTIAGTITAAAGNGAVTVSVTNPAGDYFTHVTINAVSAYSVGSIPVGSWKVRAERNGCVTEYYGGVSNTLNATTVNVTDGATAGGVSISLGAGWIISGRVQDVTAVNIAGAEIKVFRNQAGWQHVTGSITDADGNYTISDIYEGAVFLKVEKTGYRSKLWNDKLGDWDTADSFTVAESGNYASRNFELFKPATINGTVTYTSGGNAVGAVVKAFSAPGNVYLAETTVAVNGTYALGNLIPGNIKLMVSTTNAVDEYYNNVVVNSVDAWNTAATINIPQGSNLNGYNFALDKQWIISGNVSVPGATIEVFEYNNWDNYLGGATATVTGHYNIVGTGSQDVMIRYSAGNNYTKIIYPDLENFSHILPANRVTTNAEMGLKELNLVTFASAARISGIVNAVGGSGPVTINVHDVNGGYFTHITANSGVAYVLYNIPLGPWKIKAELAGCVGEYFELNGPGTTSTSNATTVNLTTAGQNYANVNIALSLPWVVTGQVTVLGSSTPLAGVKVSAYRYDTTWHWVAAATTDAQGYYVINEGYNNGLVFLQAELAGYQTLKWNNKVGNWNASDSIAMTAGATTTNFNFALYQTATINGTVRYDVSSLPVSGAAVIAYRAADHSEIGRVKTNSAGAYVLGNLIPGEFKVVVTASACTSEYWNDQLTWSEATTISLASGQTLANINFSLAQGWRLGGIVTLSDGGSLEDGIAYLYKFQDTSTLVATSSISSAGHYEFNGKANLGYQVMVQLDCGDNYDVMIFPDYVVDGTTVPESCSLNVVLGVTDITTLNITLAAILGRIPNWFDNVKNSIKAGPNPFNPEEGPVHICYVTEGSATARVIVYTVGGEQVFSERQSVGSGYHEFIWDGEDRFRQSVPNGVYLAYIEVKTNGRTYKQVKKIAVLR